MDTYLTRAEVCERLQISRETFRKLVLRGAFPVTRLGAFPQGHLRVSERALTDYMSGGKAQVKAS